MTREEMTKEEAVKRLKEARSTIQPIQYVNEAIDYAIKLIEQEPCEDAISRQTVMECYKKWQPYMATRLWDFEQELSALPPVTPQLKTGQWIERIERDDWDDSEDVWYECNPCHIDSERAFNYCPNCGAKMQEVKE